MCRRRAFLEARAGPPSTTRRRASSAATGPGAWRASPAQSNASSGSRAFQVTITTASGKAKATGKVTLTLKKGKTTKKVSGNVVNGTAKVKIPKLPKGAWTVTVLYQGNAYYLTSTAGAKLTSKAK